VSPERDEQTAEQEFELYEDVAPRSIFAATWFRVVLVVIVLGVIGAVAVPYVLDRMNPAPPRSVTTPAPPVGATPSPATSSMADKPSEKSTTADKRDSTVLPAPVTPPLALAPTRPETKSEPKSASRPTAESKATAKAALPEAKTSTPAEPKSALGVTESPATPSPVKPAPAKSARAAKSDAGKSDATASTATKSSGTRQVAAKAATPAAAGGASYWVQVGAFKDPETAKRVASKLRDENFKVEESLKPVGGAAGPDAKTPGAASSSEQYDVFVSGMSAEELNRRLAGKGLTVEALSGGGMIVKPSLPLRDAVALSKDLAADGFKVQVRRAGAGAAGAAAPTTPTAPIGDRSLHRVRVGAFADKAAAMAAARELEAKGYKPYIARGGQ
jgi:cell division septation protein DedD